MTESITRTGRISGRSLTSSPIRRHAANRCVPLAGWWDQPMGPCLLQIWSSFPPPSLQIKGIVVFCAFLGAFFSLGNLGAAFLLPALYGGQNVNLCWQAIVLAYPCN